MDGISWVVEPEVTAAFDRVRKTGRGLIIVGYHLGFFRLSASSLRQMFPGCDPVHVSHRIAHYERSTIGRVAQLALQTAIDADRQTGVRINYVDEDASLLHICRLLRDGQIVALAADGAFAKDFMDVPFFSRKLRLPCGWARLAAATQSAVLVLADSAIDRRRRKVWLFDHVEVYNDSAEELYRALTQVAKILETFVEREPWSWHPWQRLQLEKCNQDSPVMTISQLGTPPALSEGSNTTQKRQSAKSCTISAFTNGVTPANANAAWGRNGGANMQAKDRSSSGSVLSECSSNVRKVAIVANSFTPYRIYVHKRIVDEVPEVELWTVMTHGNSYGRWHGLEPPPEIRPVTFGRGEPTIEQTKLRFALREWRKFGQIIRWLDEHGIEAVICQGFGDVGRLRMLRWCRRRGIPCFLTADCNIYGDVPPGPKRLLKHVVVGQAIRWSSGVMPCGEYGRLLFERYGATRDKTFMFPLISNLELFHETPPESMRLARDKHGLDPRRRRILYSGRMMTVKRPDLTLGAFEAIAAERPEWDLIMMGDGPLREPMTAAVPRHLQGRIKWLGLVQDVRELAAVFAQCDVLVLPSDKEPWGMVVIEAAAAGLALVMTDVVGACPELVSDGENGRLFARGNMEAFVDALRDVTDPARVDELKTNSRRVLSRWLAKCDPVDGFREALASCGLICKSAHRTSLKPAPSRSKREGSVRCQEVELDPRVH
jgi:glycosyltransferase involved in cell wall biosynthesis